MSVGGEVLLDAGFRSAWARPSGHDSRRLAGQRAGRCLARRGSLARFGSAGARVCVSRRLRIAATDLDSEQIRRKSVLYGLINEYTRAA
jgi:hypothetical protein